MSLLLLASPRFAEHVTPPGHPERMERAHVFDAVATERRRAGGAVADPVPAPREALARVHADSYHDAIEATRGRAVALDPDTYTSPESYEIAVLAAGAAIAAADHAIDRSSPALALVRPPGHHAERERAMGFCLYNNVAVAAAHALARGLTRVAIVDIDVHHGNGTQEIFYGDLRVLYISTHQFPFYPGTGAADQIGSGDGRGFTVNFPLAAGATDADYDLLYGGPIADLLGAFAPELILVSAGYDAHEHDPLAGMRVSTDGYGRVVAHLRDAAARTCAGRLALVTEGGYDLKALGGCLMRTVALLSDPSSAAGPAAAPGSTDRARAALDAVRPVLKPFWPGI
jgi:acetoin utilization deacetylase AcuC-like enzyme